jgi:hypothetical protein
MPVGKITGRALAFACALGVLLLPGCNSKAELVKFNDRIAQLFRELGEADRDFYAGVYDYSYDRGDAAAALKRFHAGYDKLKGVTEEVSRQSAALQVPEADGARAFYDRFRATVKAHEEILKQFAPARDAPERTLRSDRARLRTLLDAAQARKAVAWRALDEAQKAFAGENRIKLK